MEFSNNESISISKKEVVSNLLRIINSRFIRNTLFRTDMCPNFISTLYHYPESVKTRIVSIGANL